MLNERRMKMKKRILFLKKMEIFYGSIYADGD